MARKREISPGLWENEEFVEMSAAARLTWIGLWSVCDRHGCFEWRPRKWTRLFASGIECKGEAVFQELLQAGFVERYEAEGGEYGFVVKWARHQDPHPQEKAVYPTPDSPNYCPKTSGRKQPAGNLPATGLQPADNLQTTGISPKATGKPPASRLPASPLPSFPSCPSFPSRPSDAPHPSTRPTPSGEGTEDGVGEGGWEPISGLEDLEEGQRPPGEESWHLGEVVRTCPDHKRGDPDAVKAAWEAELGKGEVTARELRDCLKATIREHLPRDGREDRTQWLTRLDLLIARGKWRSHLGPVRAQHAETRAVAERLAREPPPDDDAHAAALGDLSPEPIPLEPLTRGA